MLWRTLIASLFGFTSCLRSCGTGCGPYRQLQPWDPGFCKSGRLVVKRVQDGVLEEDGFEDGGEWTW